MSNLSSLTSAQLIKAAAIKDKIETLTHELTDLLGSSWALVKSVAKGVKKRGMSAAGRARVAAAQRARWKKIKASKLAAESSLKPAKKKKKMSAAAKAKISVAAKARWAKAKAAGNTKL